MDGVVVSDTASLTSGISGRYATALFELAKDAGQIDAVERDLKELEQALADSEDLRSLINSPIYSRAQQGAAIKAVAEKMGLSGLVSNTLQLMAAKRRLFALPAMAKGLLGLIARDRGEVTAEVTSAAALSDDQLASLSASLKEAIGQDIVIKSSVDESLIGGLVVKVGSRMIDTSIKAKLSKLQNAMKEVG